jgi:hypothetical protein
LHRAGKIPGLDEPSGSFPSTFGGNLFSGSKTLLVLPIYGSRKTPFMTRIIKGPLGNIENGLGVKTKEIPVVLSLSVWIKALSFHGLRLK